MSQTQSISGINIINGQAGHPEVLAIPHTISVVIPVFNGEKTLKPLVTEILELNNSNTNKTILRVIEILLVWDGAQDNSAKVMQELADSNPIVRIIWLSRNFGQHAATLAGVARTRGDWIATLDEDGLHNPSEIIPLLNTAIQSNYQLVYGLAKNKAPHHRLRNSTSHFAHWFFKSFLGNENRNDFSSFRLIRGDVGRNLSAYCGAGVYLDVALQWVTLTSGSYEITLRKEWRPSKSYSPFRLFAHFRRLVLSSPGTPLRAISLMGIFTLFFSIGLMAYAFYQYRTGNVPIQGWTSLFILISFFFGALMLAVGILAEYVGLILSISMGKPLYLVQSKSPIL